MKDNHQTLVDIIHERLNDTKFNNKKFYTSVGKNIEYGLHDGCPIGEVDNIAIRHGKRKTYVLLFEVKTGPHKRGYAHKQLDREESYLHHKKYGKDFKIYEFYIRGHKYNYSIERLK